jgi:broad specificity phosphatase PhoE
MILWIIRHGDKKNGEFYNEKLRHQDSPLNETGLKKAERLCDYFENRNFKKIVVSEYIRTEQTGRLLAKKKGIQLIIDKRLNEIDNGLIESLSYDEIMKKYPEFYHDFMSNSKDVRFPEGETGEEVKRRQIALLDELVFQNKDVILFSHEGYIRLFMCHILGLPVYQRNLFKVDFCGITEFEYDSNLELWKLLKFNHTLDV